jgi:Holliday junction DNA helicase RuvA
MLSEGLFNMALTYGKLLLLPALWGLPMNYETGKMINFVRGRLVEKTPTHAIVDCNGLGYELRISANTFAGLENEDCKMLTHYVVNIDVRSGASSHTLYGFLTAAERDLFKQLVTVSGVSATIGMTILSSFQVDQLQNAIMSGDDKLITSVKGIGPKLAKRIVMDLSEKVIVTGVHENIIAKSGNTAKIEALSALCSLGFDRKKADITLNAIIKDGTSVMSTEDLIKESLKVL